MPNESLLSPDEVRLDPHGQPAEAVARALGVDPKTGLTFAEVERRRKKWGKNALETVRPRSLWRMAWRQCASLIVALLAFAAVVAWVSGDRVESIAIVVVLVLNALIGFLTEWQANRALEALRREARTIARVHREGHDMTVDAAELVPGDMIVLDAGDRVPADARLFETSSLSTVESALTGESLPVNKSVEPVERERLLAERASIVYLGTTVAAGHALAVVTATGPRTELGRIGRLVAEATSVKTPLERRLAGLGRRLVYLVLAIAAAIFLTGWLRGDDILVMLKVSISLAVAAVPEGLPAVTTLILALGVLRMARQKAIVRQLPAVETLGSATIICTDKTGTLTENRMTVREYRLADGRRLELTGEPKEIKDDDLLLQAVRVGVLCNDASIDVQAGGGVEAVGDPTETALLTVAMELGVNPESLRDQTPRLEHQPFTAETKRMLTVHRGPEGRRIAFLKGAPSVVLEMCGYAGDDSTTASRGRVIEANNEMARRALRVLALADKDLGVGEAARDELEGGFSFVGLVGMIDPPREEVPEAIARARAAGIRVVMLTGDQINTAVAIARELRLSGDREPRALHARDLEGSVQGELATLARSVDVFARVSPENKLRIVEALQAAGEVVAVTGDGVNDAPALKRANIGIAMGDRGTEVAKEAADIVLADDNFATIVRAVEGGRTIYSNIIKFVHMMFTHNLGEVLTIFIAIAIGWPLPLLPLQILWINLVTDVFPAMALAVEPPAADVMRRPPRSPKAELLSRPFLLLIGWQGAMLAAIVLACYWWALTESGEGAEARTIALLSLVGVQIGHFFNCRSRTRSALEGLFSNPWIWAAAAVMAILQLMAVYLPPLARVLGTTQPRASAWMVVGVSAILPLIIVEAAKALARRGKDRSGFSR